MKTAMKAMNKQERTLFLTGLLLAAGEIYKQLLLYIHIHPFVYDWWYFPFQLCSLPMYLCLALPFIKDIRKKETLCTFLRDFNLIGGAAALAYPEGFRHLHWTLTLHGYLWHLALIGIGLYIEANHMADSSPRGYLRALVLLFFCFAIATVINVASPGHTADMFYLSPYHPSTQPVIHGIAVTFGTIPANMAYACAICLAGFLVHQGFRLFERSKGSVTGQAASGHAAADDNVAGQVGQEGDDPGNRVG